jgi:teichuronic acid exporter
LLSEKWLPVVPIMQIFCFARIVTIIAGLNVTFLYAIGRADLVLKQQVLKIIVRIVFLLTAFKFGVVYVAIAELAATLVHFFINTYYPGRIMKMDAILQLKEMLPALFSGVLMLLVLWCIAFLLPIELNSLYLVIVPMIGLITYFGIIKMLKFEEFGLLLSKGKSLLNL